MKPNLREVLALVFEFVISLVGLVGAGLLVYTGHDSTLGVSAIDLILSFWFVRRTTEALRAKSSDAGSTAKVTLSPVSADVQAVEQGAEKASAEITPELIALVIKELQKKSSDKGPSA